MKEQTTRESSCILLNLLNGNIKNSGELHHWCQHGYIAFNKNHGLYFYIKNTPEPISNEWYYMSLDKERIENFSIEVHIYSDDFTIRLHCGISNRITLDELISIIKYTDFAKIYQQSLLNFSKVKQ